MHSAKWRPFRFNLNVRSYVANPQIIQTQKIVYPFTVPCYIVATRLIISTYCPQSLCNKNLNVVYGLDE